MFRQVFILGAVLLVGFLVVRLFLLSADSRRATPPADDRKNAADRLTPCPKRPNCVSSRHGSGDNPDLPPLAVPGPADEAFEKARAAVASMPGAEIVVAEAGYLAAEFTSRWFRFVDDLELLYDAERQVFGVRSASRVGYSDLGANRRRVEALRARLVG